MVSKKPDWHSCQDYSRQRSVVCLLERCIRGSTTNPMLNRKYSSGSRKCALFVVSSASELTAQPTHLTWATSSLFSAVLSSLLQDGKTAHKIDYRQHFFRQLVEQAHRWLSEVREYDLFLLCDRFFFSRKFTGLFQQVFLVEFFSSLTFFLFVCHEQSTTINGVDIPCSYHKLTLESFFLLHIKIMERKMFLWKR